MRKLAWGEGEEDASGRYAPVLEVDGGAIVKLELWVLEDGLPVADAPLRRV